MDETRCKWLYDENDIICTVEHSVNARSPSASGGVEVLADSKWSPVSIGSILHHLLFDYMVYYNTKAVGCHCTIVLSADDYQR